MPESKHDYTAIVASTLITDMTVKKNGAWVEVRFNLNTHDTCIERNTERSVLYLEEELYPLAESIAERMFGPFHFYGKEAIKWYENELKAGKTKPNSIRPHFQVFGNKWVQFSFHIVQLDKHGVHITELGSDHIPA